MTIPISPAGPAERVAHRLGLALLAWSERRADTVASDAASRSTQRSVFEQQSGREERHRSWERLASTTPRQR